MDGTVRRPRGPAPTWWRRRCAPGQVESTAPTPVSLSPRLPGGLGVRCPRRSALRLRLPAPARHPWVPRRWCWTTPSTGRRSVAISLSYANPLPRRQVEVGTRRSDLTTPGCDAPPVAPDSALADALLCTEWSERLGRRRACWLCSAPNGRSRGASRAISEVIAPRIRCRAKRMGVGVCSAGPHGSRSDLGRWSSLSRRCLGHRRGVCPVIHRPTSGDRAVGPGRRR